MTRASSDTVYTEIINNSLHLIFIEEAGVCSAAAQQLHTSRNAEVRSWMVKTGASLAEVDCEGTELTSNLCLGQLYFCFIKLKEFTELPPPYPVYVLLPLVSKNIYRTNIPAV